MSVITTVIGRLLTVRPLEPNDLPRLLQIEKQRLGNRPGRHESLIQLPARSQGIWVASIHSVIVGYLVYQLLPEAETAGADKSVSAAGGEGAGTAAPMCVVLRQLYVVPDWQRRGIGRALIERFMPRLSQQDGYRIETVVPESNLPVQLLLRSAGYRAIRVLRRHFREEDAYLMECHRG
jgi:ribosomal protein S18 acetylase RimI-like enzyme